MEEKPGYKTMENFEAEKVIDQTALISDLSHQLEESRAQIETLRSANREWHLQVVRLEGARDSLKELLNQILETGRR
jgi:capsule polysaccharide export protein KpsE/RkpR